MSPLKYFVSWTGLGGFSSAQTQQYCRNNVKQEKSWNGV